jgi:hypothetical protein
MCGVYQEIVVIALSPECLVFYKEIVVIALSTECVVFYKEIAVIDPYIQKTAITAISL